jgi:hypothetical protein
MTGTGVIIGEDGLVLAVNGVFERLFGLAQAAASSPVYSGPRSTVSKSHADHEIPRLADAGRSSLGQ